MTSFFPFDTGGPSFLASELAAVPIRSALPDRHETDANSRARSLSTIDNRSETSDSTVTTEYDYRVLFLSGRWHRPDSDFTLEATIHIQQDGAAEGVIEWRAAVVDGRPARWPGNEQVMGAVRGAHVEINGDEAARRLACDAYDVFPAGDDQHGTFGCLSRAYGGWDGRMEGHCRFENRRAQSR